MKIWSKKMTTVTLVSKQRQANQSNQWKGRLEWSGWNFQRTTWAQYHCIHVSCGLYAACETQKVAQEAKLAMLYNVAQYLAYFYPPCNSSTDSQIGCALLYNEETIPRCLNSSKGVLTPSFNLNIILFLLYCPASQTSEFYQYPSFLVNN